VSIITGCGQKHEKPSLATWRAVSVADGHLYGLIARRAAGRAKIELWDLGSDANRPHIQWYTDVGATTGWLIGARDGALFTADSYGLISRIDAHSGELAWQTQIQDTIVAWFALSDNYVYTLSTDGTMNAIPIGGGQPVTPQHLGIGAGSGASPGGVSEPLTVARRIVVLDRAHGRLLGIGDSEGWPILWELASPGLRRSFNIAEVDGRIALASRENVQLVDPKSGESVWSKPVRSAIAARATGSHDLLYLVQGWDNDQPGNLLALDPSDGDLRWQYSPGKAGGRPRKIARYVLSGHNEVVMMTRFEGANAEYTLVAVGKQSGKKLWERPIGGRFEAGGRHPLAYWDGRVAAITRSNLVVCRHGRVLVRVADPALAED
jgi:outer membrane protein assembly factor BamB